MIDIENTRDEKVVRPRTRLVALAAALCILFGGWLAWYLWHRPVSGSRLSQRLPVTPLPFSRMIPRPHCSMRTICS